VSRRGAQRLLVFLPPRRALLDAGGRGSLSAATVVGYGGIDAALEPASAGDAPLSLLPKASSVDLLFDASDVFTSLLEAPRMPEHRLRQALPGLVEERLLSDAVDCHLAHAIEGTVAAAAGPVTRVAVAAVDRATLARALEAAAEAGLRPRAAYSAVYAIPPPSGDTISVRLDRGRGTVRSGEHAGFAFDLEEEHAPAGLTLALRQLGAARIHAYGRDAARLVPLGPQLGVEVVDLRRDFDASSVASAVNLLQGRFAAAGGFGMPTIAALARSGALKPLSIWVAVWLGVFVIGLNAYRFKLEAEARSLRSSIQTAFRSAFPSEAVVDEIAQTRRHLRELRARAGLASPDDFSVLNAQAGQLLANAPVGALAGIEYRDAALTLKFKPGAASSAQLQNALRAQAVQQGLDLRFDDKGAARVAPLAP
jgi:general secretion pathway protein L